MPFPAGRQHRKQEDTTIKHKAQRAAALHLTQITRCSSGQFSGGRRDPFLPLVLLWAGAGFFPGRHKAEVFRAGGHSHRLQKPQRPVLPGAGTLGHLLIPIALVPVFFVGLFVLCLLVTAAFLLWTGVAGLLSPVLR